MHKGLQLNSLNQAIGALRSTLKEVYSEAISLHSEKTTFKYFLERLEGDVATVKRELMEFEQITFIGKAKK